VQDRLSRDEVFGHPWRATFPESRGVCVGEDHDAHRLIVPGRLKLHRIHRRARSVAHRFRATSVFVDYQAQGAASPDKVPVRGYG
jgi:hypothetical protein